MEPSHQPFVFVRIEDMSDHQSAKHARSIGYCGWLSSSKHIQAQTKSPWFVAEVLLPGHGFVHVFPRDHRVWRCLRMKNSPLKLSASWHWTFEKDKVVGKVHVWQKGEVGQIKRNMTSLLRERASASRYVIFAKVDGILLVYALPNKLRRCSPFNKPMGICPLNLFPDLGKLCFYTFVNHTHWIFRNVSVQYVAFIHREPFPYQWHFKLAGKIILWQGSTEIVMWYIQWLVEFETQNLWRRGYRLVHIMHLIPSKEHINIPKMSGRIEKCLWCGDGILQ